MTAPNVVPANGGAGDVAKITAMEDADFAAFIGLEKTHPTAPEPTPRDTDGKFIAKDTVLTDTTLAKDKVEAPETKADDPPVVEDKPAEDAKPAEEAVTAEGKPAEDTPAEAVKPPLTKFQAFDKEGEIEPPTDLVLKYKVDGKMVDNPIEKVVHLAQQSTYNARQVQELTERNTAGDQQLQQAQEAVRQYEQGIAQMFADENLYARARALHLQSNTPERIAEAAQAEAAGIRQQHQQWQENAAVAQFVTGTIEPAIMELVKEYPSITPDDLAGRIALATNSFSVNGRVPVANLPKVRHFVDTELAEWAAAAHLKRTEASRTASQTLNKDRAAVQAKQREMGKALAPVGTVAKQAPKTAPITKASDVLNDPIFGGPQ